MVIGLNIIQIGKSIVIGTGSAVVNDVLDNGVVAGNPMKIIKSEDG